LGFHIDLLFLSSEEGLLLVAVVAPMG